MQRTGAESVQSTCGTWQWLAINLGQMTQQLQCLPDATIVQAPTLVASGCTVQSCAAVEPPVTSTTTTTRSIETSTPTRYEDTAKSSKLTEGSRLTRAASSENQKRRTRSRQRSVSDRGRDSASDSSSEDERNNQERER